MPLCFGASGSVRHSAMPIWLCWATDVHTFCPSRIHSPPPTFSAHGGLPPPVPPGPSPFIRTARAGGALDRHPGLRILIAEGGAAWVPAIGDRMDEAYRQHGMFVRPKLSRLPSEIIRQQVYASFQHDKSAVQVVPATGYRNVLWGDDYPHLEGTYGHTQETLRGLFAGVSDEVRERVTSGTFNELFRVPAQTPAQASM